MDQVNNTIHIGTYIPDDKEDNEIIIGSPKNYVRIKSDGLFIWNGKVIDKDPAYPQKLKKAMEECFEAAFPKPTSEAPKKRTRKKKND